MNILFFLSTQYIMKSFSELIRSSSPLFFGRANVSSPTSVASVNYDTLVMNQSLYYMPNQEKNLKKEWLIPQEDGMFQIPHGVYDFVIVSGERGQEIRMLKSGNNGYQHASLFNSDEAPFYAGQIEFYLGAIKFWSGQHQLEDLDCVEAGDISFPQNLFLQSKSLGF